MKRLLATAFLALVVSARTVGKEPPTDYPVVKMDSGDGRFRARLCDRPHNFTVLRI